MCSANGCRTDQRRQAVAKSNPTYQPKSLTQYFEAPEGFVGCFGWLCGYSADAAFLDIAAERFMGLTSPRRAHGGRIALAVMLDPGNPQIAVLAAPGVLHLPMKPNLEKPFKLLHAKVALLGFSEADAGERWRLRLIVSTGNWTRATQDQNIDLAWALDLNSEDLRTDDDGVCLARADVHAAWLLLTWLRRQFDDSALTAKLDSETGLALRRFESWCEAVSRPPHITSRFVDSRQASLLSQLPDRIAKRGGPGAAQHVARNYLSMGSGFYETSGAADEVPPVLGQIVKVLQDQGLLTAQADISVVVNPDNCQAVATCFSAMVAQRWRVRRPETPRFLGATTRFMHAKFIFSANASKDNCTSAWVYLGSGNLTGPGFASRMTPSAGNLEAGVLLVQDTLQWSGGTGVDPRRVVSNLLPIARGGDSVEPGALSAGAGMVDRETAFLAAPVGWLDWVDSEGGTYLAGAVSEGSGLEVLDAGGLPCKQVAPGRFAWSGERPRQAEVRWPGPGGACITLVPVLDGYGRFGATTLPAIELDAVWWQLDSFPLPPDDDDAVIDGDLATRAGNGAAEARTTQTRYPVRDMMQMIENIAARQTALRESDWHAWCNRLQQSLEQAAGSAGVACFVGLRLNPLSPLHATPFRPAFAQDASTACGLRYEQALRSVECTWGVGGLSAMGAIA